MNEPAQQTTAAKSLVPLRKILLVFLFIGATSFGGGVVAYLRSELVAKQEWLNDADFVELLSISQTLPGLNATNMAVLVGDRLRGGAGAAAATIGICLPGALFMMAAVMMYNVHGERPLVTAMLKGVAAAAVGLVLATTIHLGRTSIKHWLDVLFVLLAIVGINVLHWKVPYVLIAVGGLAIFYHRPRGVRAEEAGRE